MQEVETRSEAVVEAMIVHAKLDRSELLPASQCLHFVSQLDNEAVKLMEVDDNLLQQLEAGHRLTLRGGKEDSAVLCTADRTYEVRAAETSNALLILPESVFPEDLSDQPSITMKHVCAVKHDYLELRPIRPQLRRLHELLHESPYSGPETEAGQQAGQQAGGQQAEDQQACRYTLDDLLDRVQASEQELMTALKQNLALQIDGCWRVLDFDYLSRVLQSILSAWDEAGWEGDRLPLSTCCGLLADLYPRNIIEHVLKCYADLNEQNNSGEESADGEGGYSLNEDKVCQFFAELLLRPVDKFHLQEFVDVWQMAVPIGMKTSLHQLQGLALVDRDSKPQVIKYFPVVHLPEDPSERFNYLFRVKEKWTMDEIAPYIHDLTTDRLKIGSLLNKYGRGSNHNGIKLYSSRRPIT